jgi:hypothetical protein
MLISTYVLHVLICSICMGISYFRKQYKEQDICKKCGMDYDDIKDYIPVCLQLHCIHCQDDHMSNDMTCPKVKRF